VRAMAGIGIRWAVTVVSLADTSKALAAIILVNS